MTEGRKQGRVGDKAKNPKDKHNCPKCPHPVIGPAIEGSPDVEVNGKPALRVGDKGIHAACCGKNEWHADEGSRTVEYNNKKAHREKDKTKHCGGPGTLIEGSPNVFVGDNGSGECH